MDQQPLSRKSSRLEEEPELTIEKIPVSKKKKLAYDSLFPKNLVLFITTHGKICIWDDIPDEPEDFDIPESIHSLFKLNLAPAGVSACMSAFCIKQVTDAFKAPNLEESLKIKEEVTDLHNIHKIIKDKLASSPGLSETDNTDDLQDFMVELQREIKPYYGEEMPKEGSKYAEEFVEERNTLHKAVNLHMWLETPPVDRMNGENQFLHFFPPPRRKKMVNKRFYTDTPLEHSASPVNFGIIALNLNDGSYRNIIPDILLSMKKPQRSTQRKLFLDTSDILEFVSNITDPTGKPIVESVLILDTSCANFDDQIKEHQAKLTTLSDQYGHGNKKSKRKISKKKISKRKISKRKISKRKIYKRKISKRKISKRKIYKRNIYKK